MGKITSYTNSSGHTVHYDENGNKIGESFTSLSGGHVTHYDTDGKKTGESFVNPHGRMTHYDADGNKTGTSFKRPSGMITHYDARGVSTGESQQNFLNAYVTPAQDRSAHNTQKFPASKAKSSADGCLTVAVALAATLTVLFVIIRIIAG